MTNIKMKTAMTFPTPILGISLMASGMLSASPKLPVFANLASAMVRKIANMIIKTKATKAVMAIEVPNAAIVGSETDANTLVEFAVAVTFAELAAIS